MQISDIIAADARPALAFSRADRATVLILDEDPEMRDALASFLDRQGFQTLQARELDQARVWLAARDVDLVILGSAPGASGLQLYRSLMADHAMPTIVLSEDADATEKILALEVGADDLLQRPCNPRELLARMRALLRRTVGLGPGPRVAGWVLNRRDRTLTRPDRSVIYLTSSEFSLVCGFCETQGGVVTCETAASAVRPQPVNPRSALRTNIVRLRRAIGDMDGHVIRTVHGRGYVFAEPLSAA